MVLSLSLQQSSEGAKDGESPSVLARIVALSVSVEPTSENDLQPFISRSVAGCVCCGVNDD